jgi:hypothetical protein
MKIMGPHESLSEDLSNNYQCYRFSIVSKIFIIFLFSDFGDRSRHKGLKITMEPSEPKSNTKTKVLITIAV